MLHDTALIIEDVAHFHLTGIPGGKLIRKVISRYI